MRTASRVNVFKVLKIATLRGFGAISLLLLTYVVTNTLSTEESGKFLYFHSLVLVLAPIFVFGTNTISLREIAIFHSREYYQQLNGIIFSGFILIVAVWLLVCAISIPLVRSQLEFSEHLAWILDLGLVPLLIGLIMSLTILAAHQLQGLSQPTLSVLSLSIVSPVIFTVVMFGWPEQFIEVKSAMNLLAISSCFGLLIAVGSLLYLAPKVKPASLLPRRFIAACMPVWLVAIATAITNWGAQLTSIFYVSSQEIALLNVAQRVAMAMSLILIAVNLIISPKIASLYDQKKLDSLQKLISKTVVGIALVTAPIVLVLMVFPDAILRLFGPEYLEARLFLMIFSAGQLVNMLTGPSVQLLMMTGHEVLVMKIALFTSAITLLSAFVLINLFGAVGVAMATGLGIAVQNLLCAVFARKTTGISVFLYRW